MFQGLRCDRVTALRLEASVIGGKGRTAQFGDENFPLPVENPLPSVGAS